MKNIEDSLASYFMYRMKANSRFLLPRMDVIQLSGTGRTEDSGFDGLRLRKAGPKYNPTRLHEGNCVKLAVSSYEFCLEILNK